jgi:3-methyladenine DNA glycosylase AlkD
MPDTGSMTSFAAAGLEAVADREKAARMAAYMKTNMAFYGVQKADRTRILRELLRRFPVADRTEYRSQVSALWRRPHREEKYLAIAVARAYPRYVTLSSVPLYREMIVEGAWWDLVDEIAIHLIGAVLVGQRRQMTPRVADWIGDRDLWLRRTSIICQVGKKDETDDALLFTACSRRMHETEFFIRKAIGWALRDYTRTAPEAVRDFVIEHREQMSGLSFREATKHMSSANIDPSTS